MNFKNKVKKEIVRAFSKISDRFFNTSYFDKYQKKYANYYVCGC